MPPSLSRTSSSTSFSSNGSITSSVASASRRTRTRFTNEQLVMLEGLYHRSSHPTREERDDLARETGMETKHITIWFQNKRQMDRRVALSNATNNSSNRMGYHHTTQVPYIPLSATQPQAPTYTPTGIRRPSLDRIASHSELRNLPPRTPSRRHPTQNTNQNQAASIWENMPSSPLGPPDTPESVREEAYLEFGRQRERASGRRTLEWACASARVTGSASGKENRRGGDDVSMALDLDKLSEEEGGDETDEAEDVHEAVTPPGNSFSKEVGGRNPPGLLKAMIQDEDMMAAYILCGLGLGLR